MKPLVLAARARPDHLDITCGHAAVFEQDAVCVSQIDMRPGRVRLRPFRGRRDAGTSEIGRELERDLVAAWPDARAERSPQLFGPDSGSSRGSNSFAHDSCKRTAP